MPEQTQEKSTEAALLSKVGEILDVVNTIKTDLAVHVATDKQKQKERDSAISNLKIAVYGQVGEKSLGEDIRDNSGHIGRVEKKVDKSIKDFKDTLKWILAPTLTAIGLGVLWLIVKGAQGLFP